VCVCPSLLAWEIKLNKCRSTLYILPILFCSFRRGYLATGVMAAHPHGSGKQQPSPLKQEEDTRVAKIAEVLSVLEPIRASISQQLGAGAAGPCCVVATGYTRRRCLAFMETELSIIAAFLKTLSQQH
jgi:hypothetical protein